MMRKLEGRIGDTFRCLPLGQFAATECREVSQHLNARGKYQWIPWWIRCSISMNAVG